MIREIELGSDIMELNRLAGLVWHEAYASILSRAQIAYMIERFQSVRAITEQIALEGYRYFLLLDGGFNAGYFGVRAEEDALFLSKVYVLAQYRRRGLLREAVDRCRSLAREAGVGRIRLTVNRHNAAARAAYEALGFAVVRDTVTDIGHGYVMDDHVMELAIG